MNNYVWRINYLVGDVNDFKISKISLWFNCSAKSRAVLSPRVRKRVFIVRPDSESNNLTIACTRIKTMNSNGIT